MSNLENFTNALLALGKTDRERAQALGVSVRSVTRYKVAELLPQAERLMAHPKLLRALADDAERLQAQPAEQPA